MRQTPFSIALLVVMAVVAVGPAGVLGESSTQGAPPTVVVLLVANEEPPPKGVELDLHVAGHVEHVRLLVGETAARPHVDGLRAQMLLNELGVVRAGLLRLHVHR